METINTTDDWAIRGYLQNVLFGNESRVVTAPVARRFKMYGHDDVEFTPDSWKQGLRLIDAGFIVECSENVYYHFEGAVPCLSCSAHSFLCSEPITHLANGHGTYTAGMMHNGKFYLQQCTEAQYREKKAFKGLILL